MPVTLYQSYSLAEAIAAFGDESAARFFCHDNFVVLPDAILCLLTLGDPRSGPYIDRPFIVWRHPDWPDALPAEFTESIRPRGVQPSTHVFLRREGEDRFCYVGQARLCRCGIPQYVAALFPGPGKDLPRDIWERYGRGSDWLVDLNHELHWVACGDVEALRRLASAAASREYSYLSVRDFAHYEIKGLTVFINGRRGMLIYFHDDDPWLWAADPTYPCEPGAEEYFRNFRDCEAGYPARATLPRETAIGVIEEYFVTGELPGRFPWVENPRDI